jgi:hypothetical protein
MHWNGSLIPEPRIPEQCNPARFEVTRKGTPDPVNSVYYVVDMVYDQYARIALQRLASLYRGFGQSTKADHIEWLLDATKQDHFSFMDVKYPKKRQTLKGRGL